MEGSETSTRLYGHRYKVTDVVKECKERSEKSKKLLRLARIVFTNKVRKRPGIDPLLGFKALWQQERAKKI